MSFASDVVRIFTMIIRSGGLNGIGGLFVYGGVTRTRIDGCVTGGNGMQGDIRQDLLMAGILNVVLGVTHDPVGLEALAEASMAIAASSLERLNGLMDGGP